MALIPLWIVLIVAIPAFAIGWLESCDRNYRKGQEDGLMNEIKAEREFQKNRCSETSTRNKE